MVNNDSCQCTLPFETVSASLPQYVGDLGFQNRVKSIVITYNLGMSRIVLSGLSSNDDSLELSDIPPRILISVTNVRPSDLTYSLNYYLTTP